MCHTLRLTNDLFHGYLFFSPTGVGGELEKKQQEVFSVANHCNHCGLMGSPLTRGLAHSIRKVIYLFYGAVRS